MKTLFTILVVAALSFLSSCNLFHNNDDPQLPPITMEGKNTFGCLVNGKVWLPKGSLLQEGTFIDFLTTIDTMGAVIYADNVSLNNGLAISLYDAPTLLINKLYDLTNSGFYGKYDKWVDNQACFYEKVLTGYISLLKLDIKNRIISGTFAFEVYSVDCGDTVKITEGRFDLHYD